MKKLSKEKLLDWLSFINGLGEDALTEDEFYDIDPQAYEQVYDLIKESGQTE